MRRSIVAGLVALLAAMTVTGCKTTEKNYRDAYEVARQKQDRDGGIDSTIYNRMRPQGRGTLLAAGNDTLTMHTLPIGYPEKGGADRDNIRKYCVVVAQFKQIFNALSMRERLVADGYDAVVVNTREPLYYVVAGSVATPDEAAALVRKIGDDARLVIREPFPWILRPAHLAR